MKELLIGRRAVKFAWLVILLFVGCCPILAQAQVPTEGVQEKLVHSREFWRAIAKNVYVVPSGQAVFPLVRELSGALGSKDPELRDDLAYTILATWIVEQKQLSATELTSVLDEWQKNLLAGIGETVGDGVLKRSFSALCLAALAERDLKTPFLGEARYRTLLADALAYLKDERDLRGFDPAIGWIHATAHTADLLAALASNPFFKAEDQRRLLDALSERLSSAHEVFSYGEQNRLALAAATIVRRRDFDLEAFHQWLTALQASDERVWKNSPPHQELLQTFENDTYLLQGLAVRLCMEPASPGFANAQNLVMQVLRKR
jgi:Protein of unknown function (DUF2785)